MTGLIVKMCLIAWPQAILETGLELIVTLTSLIHQMCLLAWPKAILDWFDRPEMAAGLA